MFHSIELNLIYNKLGERLLKRLEGPKSKPSKETTKNNKKQGYQYYIPTGPR